MRVAKLVVCVDWYYASWLIIFLYEKPVELFSILVHGYCDSCADMCVCMCVFFFFPGSLWGIKILEVLLVIKY